MHLIKFSDSDGFSNVPFYNSFITSPHSNWDFLLIMCFYNFQLSVRKPRLKKISGKKREPQSETPELRDDLKMTY